MHEVPGVSEEESVAVVEHVARFFAHGDDAAVRGRTERHQHVQVRDGERARSMQQRAQHGVPVVAVRYHHVVVVVVVVGGY